MLRRQLKRIRVEKEVLSDELAAHQKKERVHALTRKQLQLATERLKGLERATAGTDKRVLEQDLAARSARERAASLESQLAGYSSVHERQRMRSVLACSIAQTARAVQDDGGARASCSQVRVATGGKCGPAGAMRPPDRAPWGSSPPCGTAPSARACCRPQGRGPPATSSGKPLRTNSGVRGCRGCATSLAAATAACRGQGGW